MIEIRTKLAAGSGAEAGDALELPFEQRRKSRLHAKLESGEEVALVLPRGTLLRGGDVVVASDGRAIEIVAQAEPVLHVECATPAALAQAAYHLGNRHVPVQVGDGWLRIAADHVLASMLAGLGARVTAMQAPFEPEAGAYSPDHRHESHETGRIHEYGGHGHE